MSADKKKSGLTKDELTAFRKALLDKRRQIVGDVEALEDQAQRGGDDEVSVDHMADHGSDSYEKDQTIGHIERESSALKDVAAALQRIEEGVYGICEECEKPVKKTRLRALPYARNCLECQIALEEGRV